MQLPTGNLRMKASNDLHGNSPPSNKREMRRERERGEERRRRRRGGESILGREEVGLLKQSMLRDLRRMDEMLSPFIVRFSLYAG